MARACMHERLFHSPSTAPCKADPPCLALACRYVQLEIRGKHTNVQRRTSIGKPWGGAAGVSAVGLGGAGLDELHEESIAGPPPRTTSGRRSTSLKNKAGGLDVMWEEHFDCFVRLEPGLHINVRILDQVCEAACASALLIHRPERRDSSSHSHGRTSSHPQPSHCAGALCRPSTLLLADNSPSSLFSFTPPLPSLHRTSSQKTR